MIVPALDGRMTKGVLRTADKTVDRIGYWYGFARIIGDHWPQATSAALLWGGAVAYYSYRLWEMVAQIAEKVGWLFYLAMGATLFFGLVGLTFSVTLVARVITGKTWLGFERDLAIQAQPIEESRTALADRADAVGAKVASIYGQWESDHAAAWHEDSMSMMNSAGDDRMLPTRNASDNVNRKYIERYCDQCLGEVWSVIGLARKFVPLDRLQVWHLSHGVRSATDIHRVVVFLGSISASLRNEQPDLPMFHLYGQEPQQDTEKGSDY